jgi:Holliday junction resolvase-like predicted endonuclease
MILRSPPARSAVRSAHEARSSGSFLVHPESQVTAVPPMTSFHVGIAAEAFAAGFFAQAGCEVSVQYGANQPEYDLLVARPDAIVRVSVKGSQSGSWGLVQKHKRGRTYHQAIDIWAAAHRSHTIYCLVQFWGVSLGQSPRAYLATVGDISDYLKRSRAGAGATILRENYSFRKGVAAGVRDAIPSEWTFSEGRVAALLRSVGQVRPP